MKRIIASLALVSAVMFGFATPAHADEVVIAHPVRHHYYRHHRRVIVVHQEPVHHEEVIVR